MLGAVVVELGEPNMNEKNIFSVAFISSQLDQKYPQTRKAFKLLNSYHNYQSVPSNRTVI